MNKRGFTLIELLVVLIIMAVILSLIIPTITRLVDDRKVEAYNKLIAIFENAAELYVMNNAEDIHEILEQDGETSVSLSSLVDMKYLNSDLTNPITDEPISSDKRVIIVRDSNQALAYCFEDRTDCAEYFYSVTLAYRVQNNLQTKNNSRYFVGQGPNNWIEFGQVSEANATPLMWRIVRVDEEGIKLVYEGIKNGTSEPTANGRITIGANTTFIYDTSSNKWVGTQIASSLATWYSSVYFDDGSKYLSNMHWCISGVNNDAPTLLTSFYAKECMYWITGTGTYRGRTASNISYGLLKASDYMGASSATTCVESTSNDCGILTDGSITNYLYKNYSWWMGTANSSNTNTTWIVESDGSLGSSLITVPNSIRPVINVYPNVIYKAGLGTLASPYTIRPAVGSSIDREKPILTILGSETTKVALNTTYTDAGASAYDNIDGDLSKSVSTTSTVNTTVAGTYTVTYNVTDSSGNAALPKVRTVIVQ